MKLHGRAEKSIRHMPREHIQAVVCLELHSPNFESSVINNVLMPFINISVAKIVWKLNFNMASPDKSRSVTHVIVCNLWLERNRRIFSNMLCNLDHCIYYITNNILLWSTAFRDTWSRNITVPIHSCGAHTLIPSAHDGSKQWDRHTVDKGCKWRRIVCFGLTLTTRL